MTENPNLIEQAIEILEAQGAVDPARAVAALQKENEKLNPSSLERVERNLDAGF